MKDSINTDIVKIGVVGAGSWGTALADLLAKKGFAVDLWVFESEVCRQIVKQRENKLFLPGVLLSENLKPSNNFTSVVAKKDLVLIVVPSHVMRQTTLQMAPFLGPETTVVTASKGIENKTHLTMSGILHETLPGLDENRLAVLSGPSFAKEVAHDVPTLVTVASKNNATAGFVQQVFATPYFRVYTSNDVVGVELGGAVKNVIAIASGIIDGLGLGLNTRAALITRGLVEIQRLGMTLGGNPLTFTGLAGAGDLILTCTGSLSRNYTVGRKIGKGMTLGQILSEMHMVAEGVKTTRSVYNLSLRLGVEMPIAHEIYHVLYDNKDPGKAVNHLMARNLKQEFDL